MITHLLVLTWMPQTQIPLVLFPLSVPERFLSYTLAMDLLIDSELLLSWSAI